MSTKNTPEEVGTELQLSTGDQVDHVEGLVRKRLRGLPRDQIQLLITNGGIYIHAYNKMLDEVFSRLTGIIIVRRIKPDRTRTPRQVLDATNRRQYTSNDVVVTMPMGEGNEEVEMTFFKPGRCLSLADLAAEYDARDLEPDPVALAALNEADPAFADEHPNATQWKLPGGGYGFMTFYRDGGERYVRVDRDDHGWDADWSFGGARKKKVLGS
ncbi:hypothetical protein HY625_03245 [Candidatus Uhrbacteria bacterium]|nr:hypothetical protein [Candidatus Uhrbacteria bacterium]